MANQFFPGTRYEHAQFKPFGKWDEVVKGLNRFDQDIKRASLDAQAGLAKEIINRVRWHLIKQDLRWRPLKRKYKRLKQELGLDTRKLIAHGTYYEAIEMWHRANGWQYFVGIKRGKYGFTTRGKRSKIDLSSVAIIQEFGKFKRPLWNPTISEMGYTAGIKSVYLTKLENLLRRRGLGKYVKKLTAI